jgi:DNA polymerase-1
MVQADYSQIELMIMAMMSNDEQLLKLFNEGVDVHRHIASRILRKAPEEITKEERVKAKRTVFGLNYGQGEEGLAQELGITLDEATAFRNGFFDQFPGVAEWIHRTKMKAINEGFVETFFGRIRRLPEAKRRDNAGTEALRQAINAPIQGTAGDVLSYAQGQLHEYIERSSHAPYDPRQYCLLRSSKRNTVFHSCCKEHYGEREV